MGFTLKSDMRCVMCAETIRIRAARTLAQSGRCLGWSCCPDVPGTVRWDIEISLLYCSVGSD